MLSKEQDYSSTRNQRTIPGEWSLAAQAAAAMRWAHDAEPVQGGAQQGASAAELVLEVDDQVTLVAVAVEQVAVEVVEAKDSQPAAELDPSPGVVAGTGQDVDAGGDPVGVQQPADPVLAQPNLLTDAPLGPAQAGVAVGEVRGEVAEAEGAGMTLGAGGGPTAMVKVCSRASCRWSLKGWVGFHVFATPGGVAHGEESLSDS
jgi:hypothetical protein